MLPGRERLFRSVGGSVVAADGGLLRGRRRMGRIRRAGRIVHRLLEGLPDFRRYRAVKDLMLLRMGGSGSGVARASDSPPFFEG